MQSSELEVRQMIVHKMMENLDLSGSSIAKLLKLPKSTVNGVIKRFKESLTVDRARGSGKKAGPADKKLTQKVLKSFMNNPGISIRDRAKKFNTSASNIFKIRSRCGYKSFRAIKQPNRNDKQNLVAKKRARRLYDRQRIGTKQTKST